MFVEERHALLPLPVAEIAPGVKVYIKESTKQRGQKMDDRAIPGVYGR